MVKAHWDDEELIENWTLNPTELELVSKKVGANQIGFAILLKYFQTFARFPSAPTEIPDTAISILHNSLKFPLMFIQNTTGKDALSAIIVGLSANCLDFGHLLFLMQRRWLIG